MTKSRRDFLTGSGRIAAIVAATAAIVPQFPIPGLTQVLEDPKWPGDVITLERLAAEGKFASSPLSIPANVHNADYAFWFNGVKQSNIFLTEIYAPGDESGWAIVYRPGENGDRLIRDKTGEPILDVVQGNWRFEIVDDPEDRTKAPAHVPGVY